MTTRSSTYTGTYTAGISDTEASSVTILSPAEIESGGIALKVEYYFPSYSVAIGPATVTNFGAIDGGVIGVDLESGGTLVNEGIGYITAGGTGVVFYGSAASLANSGKIEADAVSTAGGAATWGVELKDGGVVTNMSGGLIAAGGDGIYATAAAVFVYTSIVNYGTIESTSTTAFALPGETIASPDYYDGIHARYGEIVNEAGGLILGATAGVDDERGTIVNAGSIVADATAGELVGATGIYMGSGTVSNESGGVIEGPGDGIRIDSGTIVNYGTIEANAALASIGVSVSYAATIENFSGGTIIGASGIQAVVYNSTLHAPTTLVNYGLVEGRSSFGSGVDLAEGGEVLNHATIIAANGLGGKGVYLGAGGTVVNYGLSSEIAGGKGIVAAGGLVVINNQGTIDGGASDGIYLKGTTSVVDLVTNHDLIEGAAYGIDAIDGAASIVNDGAIEGLGSASTGVLMDTGTLVNDNLIEGGTGVSLTGAGTVINYGTISGSGGTSVYFYGGGDVLLVESGAVFDGAIEGGGGTLDLAHGSDTLTGIGGRYGTLSGDASGTFTGFGSYVVGAGDTATLTGGNVFGARYGVTVDGTLVDAGKLATEGQTTLAGVATIEAGATLTNTGTIVVDAGTLVDQGVLGGAGRIEIEANATLALDAAISGPTLAFAGHGMIELAQGAAGYGGVSIAGFTTGDHVDFADIAYRTGDSVTYANGHLYLENAGTLLLEVNFTEAAGTGKLLATDMNGGTEITVSDVLLCFYPGTLIRTPAGEAPVETLRIGDLVTTHAGAAVPVRWVGRQTVSTRFGDPLRVLPIRIRAGALGDNLPVRDLLCSPDHAFLIDDVLIQAGALVNGTTIVRERDVPEIFTFWHLECDGHELILAEGVPAETFVDNADRLAFDNWDEHLALFPEGKPVTELPWPRAKAARQVPLAIRQRVARRAAA